MHRGGACGRGRRLSGKCSARHKVATGADMGRAGHVRSSLSDGAGPRGPRPGRSPALRSRAVARGCIRLPSERIEQLRQIAEARHTTIAEVIARFVRSEIAAGTIPATVPGVVVQRTGAEIIITANGFDAAVPMDQGPTLADVLKGAATLSVDPERKKQWLEGLAALSGIQVKRAGNGLKLVSGLTKREFPLALDVAVDLGEAIARAAEQERGDAATPPRPMKVYAII
ncbi:hypothetical protein LY44_01049 [Rhodobacter capsulatus]|nr:hypothetical protein LY44_01049 [Rhodobacter capsulatus]